MLAVDTEEVAVLEASLHPTNEPPPAFPEEPDYAPPTDTPPSFGLEEYLRLSPSLYSVHGPSRVPSPEPLPIPPRTNTLPKTTQKTRETSSAVLAASRGKDSSTPRVAWRQHNSC